ncbi:MAG: 16S rRNA (cytidine(1402)-2'-O)-methyltransferase [Pseudomonadales bacterium]|nr:16S rRNA (cytidine(1402)-2'-O)-methyltransferase [Pseudomonadales bacterium]
MSLYIVATPIGNREDITARALKVLASVDLIAAEDTRHSRALLLHFGIDTPLVAYHDHNEQAATEKLVEKLLSGLDVALISDAGTPLISDPGYRLVARAQQAGVQVVPIPGASALLAALSVSGMATDRFKFEGFLPAKQTARIHRLESLQYETNTLVFYEAPHRIQSMLIDLVTVLGGMRLATVGRELTKKFEQVEHACLTDLLARVEAGDILNKGEFVVVVAGNQDTTLGYETRTLMLALLAELPPRKAARVAQKVTGMSSKDLYAIAIALKKGE